MVTLPALGQLKYKNVEDCYRAHYPGEDLHCYQSIFILRFGFCNGSAYCGNTLLKYVEKEIDKTKGKTLIITGDTLQPLVIALAGNEHAVIRYISSEGIEKYGLFSGYNLHINKHGKIKRLI